jgi:DNA primase catalytic subunit
MLTLDEIKNYYENASLNIPECWNLSRKHVRIVLRNGRFVKLNRFRNRLNPKFLRYLCVKHAPVHVYFSVLDWLFPERVGKKYKAKYAVPVGGAYIFDVDCNNVWVPHNHNKWRPVCTECLYISKNLTLHICEAIEENYRDIQIVFSGRRGFHIHVLNFDFRDWTHYNPKNPIKSHEVARFKYTKNLSSCCYGFNRPHFIVATDPMRIISLPNSLNGESGLVCLPLGNRKSFEKLNIESLIQRASHHQHASVFVKVSDYTHSELNESADKLSLFNAQRE